MAYIIKNTSSEPDLKSVTIGYHTANNSIGYTGGEIPICVSGKNGTKYKIRVEKQQGLTTGLTHASGYYDWTKKIFTTLALANGANIETGTIENGKKIHYVMLPVASADTRYDVFIDNLVDGVTAKLKSTIPTQAGDLSMIQYGTRTMTISTETADSTDYTSTGADVTITRPYYFEGSAYYTPPLKSVYQTGGTGGASSTTLTLDKENPRIRQGMIVTCDGAAHQAKITSIKGRVITLNNACTIANGTMIRFDLDNGRLVPFTFTMTPAGGHAIDPTADARAKDCIGGLKESVLLKINSGGGVSGKSITVDTSRGVITGMVLGNIGNYVKDQFGRDVTVTVNDATRITITDDVIAADDTEFYVFADTTTHNSFAEPKANTGVNIHSITVQDSHPNVIVYGYLNVERIDATLTHPLYLDDIITVS